MKFLVALIATLAVANASLLQPLAQLAQTVAAIHSPSTDPATAQLLHQQMLELLGISQPSVVPVPTPTADITGAESPLVQIIVNVQDSLVHPNPVVVEGLKPVEVPVLPEPVVLPPPVLPTPVWPPVIIPGLVVRPPTPVITDPVGVVETPQPEPISVGTPVLPVPVNPVNLPETLN